MIYGDPCDAVLDGYPPGHLAGTDEFISVGAVLFGRGLETGGVLGTQPRADAEPTSPVQMTARPVLWTGPIVLIAVDGTRMSERVVRTAHRLFGEAATYLAINVGSVHDTRMSWAYVWPVSGPTTWNPSTGVDDIAHDEGRTAAGLATDEAAAIACGAGLVQATSLGDVGDPSTAIVQAARHHRADVVVIGADSRGWLGRLFDGSVERDVLREAGSAVLVVDAGGTVAQR